MPSVCSYITVAEAAKYRFRHTAEAMHRNCPAADYLEDLSSRRLLSIDTFSVSPRPTSMESNLKAKIPCNDGASAGRPVQSEIWPCRGAIQSKVHWTRCF